MTLREPTCTSPGVGQRSCVLCSFTEEFEIPVAEHTYLWHYQMEQPACTECGHAAEICAHQYELTNTAESSARFPGWRTYTCTLCQETDTVYFDQFGDYELGAIRDTVNAMAKDMGFTVIYPYGASSELADHNAYQTADYVSFKYGEANEKLEQAAKTSLEQLQQLLTDEGLNPGDHYLWIEFSYSTFAGASFFRVDIYTIRHTWPKPE